MLEILDDIKSKRNKIAHRTIDEEFKTAYKL